MNRRRFLAHALRLPAAVVALPLVGGLTAAQEAEPVALPEAQQVEADYALAMALSGNANVTIGEDGWHIVRNAVTATLTVTGPSSNAVEYVVRPYVVADGYAGWNVIGTQAP